MLNLDVRKWAIQNFPYLISEDLTDLEIMYRLLGEINRMSVRIDQLPEEVQTAVNNWINEHPEVFTIIADGTISEVKLDDTLIDKINYPMDVMEPRLEEAETNINVNRNNIEVNSARISEIVALPEGSTTGDAELMDIRISANGTVYSTAGDAVRTQVTSLSDSIGVLADNLTNIKGFTVTPAYEYSAEQGSINSSGVETASNQSIRSEFIDLSKVDKIEIGEHTGNLFACWYYDLDNFFQRILTSTAGSVLTEETSPNWIASKYVRFSYVAGTGRPLTDLTDLVKVTGKTIVSPSKLVITIKDFGAVGDGVADDTDALQAAFNYQFGTVYVPKGTYKVTKTITIPSGARIVGFGADSCIKIATYDNLTPIAWRSDYKYPIIITDDMSDGCIIDGIRLTAEGVYDRTKSVVGIYIRGKNHVVKNCIVDHINYDPVDFPNRVAFGGVNGSAWNIGVLDAENVHIEHCVTTHAGYEGLGTEASTRIYVTALYSHIANRTTLQLHRLSKNIIISNCVLDNTESITEGTSALTMHGVEGEVVDTVIIKGNVLKHGIVGIYGGEYNVTISDNRFECVDDNGRILINTSGTHGNDKNWIITGNYFLGKVSASASDTSGSQINVSIDGLIIANNIMDYYRLKGIIAHGENVFVGNNLMLRGSMTPEYS